MVVIKKQKNEHKSGSNQQKMKNEKQQKNTDRVTFLRCVRCCAGTRSLEELLTPVMGAFKECVFKHADSEEPRMMLAASYPPADSAPDQDLQKNYSCLSCTLLGV